MSATNIQWITIAVLGFGAVFAFFVLVFIFEATVHALRYRDQYAGGGGGGGFRMPSFGGRHGGAATGDAPSGKSLRRRDPKLDRALAREAARIAADERAKGGVHLRQVVPDPDDDSDESDELDQIGADSSATDELTPSVSEAVADVASDDDSSDEIVTENVAAFPSEPPMQLADDLALDDDTFGHMEIDERPVADRSELAAVETDSDVEQSVDEDIEQSEAPAPEPLILTASQEVERHGEQSSDKTEPIQKLGLKAKVGRMTMRATKGPLIATPSTFKRRATPPTPGPQPESDTRPALANNDRPRVSMSATVADDVPASSEADDATPVGQSGEPLLSNEASAPETLRATERQQPSNDVHLRTGETEIADAPDERHSPVGRPDDENATVASEPASKSVDAEATVHDASEAGADIPSSKQDEKPRVSKVAQPSQPESEVMADTTRQLQSLRDAEEFGGALRTDEVSCPLYLRYKSASGIVFDRIVQAVTLEETNGELIMRAFCHRSKAMRRIRVDNVVAAFDLRNRDVSVGGKVPEFLKARIKMRDADQSGSSSGGFSPAAAE